MIMNDKWGRKWPDVKDCLGVFLEENTHRNSDMTVGVPVDN
jgi:hypothetical protein